MIGVLLVLGGPFILAIVALISCALSDLGERRLDRLKVELEAEYQQVRSELLAEAYYGSR